MKLFVILSMFASGLSYAEDYLAQTQQLKDHIWVGPQMAREDVEQLKKLGISHVVNFRTQGEMDGLDFNEHDLLNQTAINYLSIPIGKEQGYSPEKLAQFTAFMTAHESEPMLLHCRSGYRANVMYAAWLIQSKNLSPLEAKEKVHAWSDEAVGQLLNQTVDTEE